METLHSFFVYVAIFAGAAMIWCLYKLYSGASRSTKRLVHICFWVALAIPMILLSPYVDFEKAFRRSAVGGTSALIVMGLFYGIMFLVGKFGKKDKNDQ